MAGFFAPEGEAFPPQKIQSQCARSAAYTPSAVERAPKSLDDALREAQKHIAHGIGAGETINPQHGVKSFVRAQPLAVRKATGARDHRTQKRHEGMSGRDGIRRRMRKRHGLAELWSETYFVKKLQKAYQATKGRDSSGSTTQKNWLFGQRRVERGAYRSVQRLRLFFVW
jgi:hypothetical protein